MKTVVRLLLLSALSLAASTPAFACAACYRNSSGNDKMSNAASIGIFAMVVIMFIMLGAVAAFGWHLSWRAKHPLPDYNELINGDAAHDDTSHPDQED